MSGEPMCNFTTTFYVWSLEVFSVLSFHFFLKVYCIFLFYFWMDEAVCRYQYYIIDIGWYNVISWMLLH
jgi:NADH:ubiquinone oxidoreductase subunit H